MREVEVVSSTGGSSVVREETYVLPATMRWLQIDAGGSVTRCTVLDGARGVGWILEQDRVVDLDVRKDPIPVLQLEVEFREGTGLEVFSLPRLIAGARARQKDREAEGASGGPPDVSLRRPVEYTVGDGGEVRIDGRPHRVLEVVEKGGGEGSGMSGMEGELVSRYAFDIQTGLLAMKEKIARSADREAVSSQTYYRDYRMIDDLIKLPFVIETKRQDVAVSEIRVRGMAVNRAVDPGLFKRPSIEPR